MKLDQFKLVTYPASPTFDSNEQMYLIHKSTSNIAIKKIKDQTDKIVDSWNRIQFAVVDQNELISPSDKFLTIRTANPDFSEKIFTLLSRKNFDLVELLDENDKMITTTRHILNSASKVILTHQEFLNSKIHHSTENIQESIDEDIIQEILQKNSGYLWLEMEDFIDSPGSDPNQPSMPGTQAKLTEGHPTIHLNKFGQPLSDEELAYIFSLYRGKTLVEIKGAEDMKKPLLLGVSNYDIAVSGNEVFLPYASYKLKDAILILKNLDNLTDADIINLAKLSSKASSLSNDPTVEILRINRNDNNGPVIEYRWKTNSHFSRSNNGYNYSTCQIDLNYINNGFMFQYLIREGYAVKLYFGPEHPLNGKTAVELGVAKLVKTKAIEKTEPSREEVSK